MFVKVLATHKKNMLFYELEQNRRLRVWKDEIIRNKLTVMLKVSLGAGMMISTC